MAEKSLYIISGPNGAGKTTASYTVLPKILQCKEFVNADEIARGLSPFNPESVAIEAGRLMLKRIAYCRHMGIVNNGEMPRSIIATGGKGQNTIIKDNEHYKKIEEHVKR